MLERYVCLHTTGKTSDESLISTLTPIFNAHTGTKTSTKTGNIRMDARTVWCASTATDGRSVSIIQMFIRLANARQRTVKMSTAPYTIRQRNRDKRWASILNFSQDAEPRTSHLVSIHLCFTIWDHLNHHWLEWRSLRFRWWLRKCGLRAGASKSEILRTRHPAMVAYNQKPPTLAVTSKTTCLWKQDLLCLQAWGASLFQILTQILLQEGSGRWLSRWSQDHSLQRMAH